MSSFMTFLNKFSTNIDYVPQQMEVTHVDVRFPGSKEAGSGARGGVKQGGGFGRK